MVFLILLSKVIHTDDTKIKMLAPGICQECKFWPYLGDWMHRYVVYDFRLDRTRHGPLNFLKGYKGYLQADAFSGFDCVYASGDVREVACWTHTRRYWYEAKFDFRSFFKLLAILIEGNRSRACGRSLVSRSKLSP